MKLYAVYFGQNMRMLQGWGGIKLGLEQQLEVGL